MTHSHRRPKLMKPSGMIFPEPRPVTDDRFFRDALGRFATGITVITCRDPGTGQPQGFTANSFSSLSLDPPLVLFSLRREAQCLPAFLGSGAFAVNVLAHDQMEVSARFASSDPDRWAGIEHAVWSTGAPILPEMLASFECRTVATHEGGDHVIFIGEVLALSTPREAPPLLYFRGAYQTLKV
ncbi:flavin reductase family protein [Ectothiorhodospira sp. PHS-1]|uniref:flavin reductase family protein n=2 Tax=Ectothiorhodospira TaxID=1051 RepID=UPI001AEF77A0|nr:flavin reductase family protein [Ectothiorhodospira sp. PHS-1]